MPGLLSLSVSCLGRVFGLDVFGGSHYNVRLLSDGSDRYPSKGYISEPVLVYFMGERGLGIKGWLSGPAEKQRQQKTETVSESSEINLDKHRIAVLPLANISPSPSDEFFADGLTEELISVVSRIPGLKTISRTSVMRYKGSAKAVPEIARELNVGTVLEGSVRKAGNRLRVNMQLIDVASDEPLCAESYDRELEDVFAIQSDIANCLAKKLEVQLMVGERRRIEKKPTENIEAYTLYLQALHYRGAKTEEGFRKAVDLLMEAVRKDLGFAVAYETLADCYERMGEAGILPPKESFPVARKYAEMAISLDESLAEPHATIGALCHEFYYDQVMAEKEFRRALSLNPNFGKVCHSYSAHLAGAGRLDEAIKEVVRAQELNPLALEVNDCAAVIYNCADQTDKSLKVCERMLEIDENYFPAYEKIAETYIHKAMIDDAIAACQKGVALSKGSPSSKSRLGFAYACAGRTDEARKILRELEEDANKRYVSPTAIALVHCGLGEKAEAIRWLERACDERAGGITAIKARPMWASLRAEPGFKKLLDKMGLNA